MKFIKLSLAAALAVTLAHAEEASDLVVSANMSATSNYIWRGMTQTDDSPALQGGFGVDYKGIYATVWGSNVDFGDTTTSMEADVAVGYKGAFENLGYDIGIVQLMYPNDTDTYNFAEAYFGLTYDFKVFTLGAKYYAGINTNDVDVVGEDWKPTDTWEGTIAVPLFAEISLNGTYGDYLTVGNYYSVGLSKTFGKFDFSVAYAGIQADAEDSDQNNFVATIGTKF